MKSSSDRGNRSGSALLVVLGFLSFMVVSAVAFAIYMRAERVPSSALRRNVATRHLVKAALAHAMSRVDDAIRADPFPGRPNTNRLNTADFYHDAKGNAMNVWYGRVFMPPDPEGVTDQANDPSNIGDSSSGFASRFAPITETVSTLTLEALGYIPPPLVNDVRFLSRSTWTAKWQNFAYDAGRFAFCAVNVSDFLDINRVSAGIRTSASQSRISVAHLLRSLNDQSEFSDVAQPDIDNFNTLFGPSATARPMEKYYPYVSMLDYNLALGTKGDSGINNIIRSCFCWWINGATRDYFYFNGSTDSSDGVKSAMRQPFVTDSWATSASGASWAVVTNVSDEVADISTLKGQPFNDLDMTGNGMTATKVATSSSKFIRQMYDKGLLGRIDVFTLYDYLDHDDVPLSLAMPSVECVPMVAAVEAEAIPFGVSVAAGTPQVSAPPAGQAGVKTTTTQYTLTLDPRFLALSGFRLPVLAAFPFRHFKGRNIDDFKVQAVMKVFLASGAVSVRPVGDLAALHPNDNVEWNSQESKAFEFNGNTDALVWSLYSTKKDLNIDSISDDAQENAVLKVVVDRWQPFSGNIAGSPVFFTEITEEDVSPTGATIGTPRQSYEFNLRPFADGALVPQGKQQGAIAASPLAAAQFRVYAAMWIRITNGSGSETYDLAPAVVGDDVLNNRAGTFATISQHGGTAPGMLFFADGNPGFTYANVASINYQSPSWNPKSLATVDPRYNYAPEDWFVWNKSNISGKNWVDDICDAGALGIANNRDADIFMFTSNQGYLQSLGEFAFLPMLSEQRSPPTGYNSPILQNAPGASATATYAAQPKDILNWNCVWRTYPVDGDFFHDCASIGIWQSSKDAQTVNPYSDNAEVLYAAFANTPCDYWVTGRSIAGLAAKDMPEDAKTIFNKMGDKDETSGDKIKTFEESLKNAFCEENADSGSKIRTENVKAIAAKIGGVLQTYLPQSNEGYDADLWKSAYDALPWFDGLDPKDDSTYERFMGVDLENPLYSVDRKFLYSYWRECFANKQQLFLIFVRAESSALGGTGEGTPAQQGGRAVALVWRDPHPNHTDGGRDGKVDDRYREYNTDGHRRPHRMRVLFYHQFD